MTSRPIVIHPLAAGLFAAIPIAACAAVAVVVLAHRPSPLPLPSAPPAAAPAPAAQPQVAPPPALEPTVAATTRHGEVLSKLEADDYACRANAQNSVIPSGNVQTTADKAAAPTATGAALQTSYNLAYSQCMNSLGYTIDGQSPTKTAAKVIVAPPPPREVEITSPPPEAVVVLPPRPPFPLLPPPPPGGVVFIP
jgi:hypothetical protein